jgi:hypothetical protein
VPYKESLLHKDRKLVKEGLYRLRELVNLAVREQKFRLPVSHMSGIQNMLTSFEAAREAQNAKREERRLKRTGKVISYTRIVSLVLTVPRLISLAPQLTNPRARVRSTGCQTWRVLLTLRYF